MLLHHNSHKKFNPRKKAFTLIELLIVMGVIAVLVTLALLAVIALQRRSRDSQRTNALADILSQITNYRRANLEYPDELTVTFASNQFTISNSFTIELKGPATPSDETTATSTQYLYEKIDNANFALCAKLESGSVQNVGTDDCGDF